MLKSIATTILLLLTITLLAQLSSTKNDIILGVSNYNTTNYVLFESTSDCDVSIIHNEQQICFYTAIETVNYIQISSLDFDSKEIAMILQSIKLEGNAVGQIRTDHKNNTVFVYSNIEKGVLAVMVMDRISTN